MTKLVELSKLSWKRAEKKNESEIHKVAKKFNSTLNTKPGTTVDVDILGVSSSYFKKYAGEVIKNRALPDYRDGLKPVHRKILWAGYVEGFNYNKPYVKAAKWHGVTMGNYSPHGDSSLHSAMQTMVLAPYSLVDGSGSWGWFAGEDAAAQRYVEARLSKFAQTLFLDPEYLAVTPMVSNYDGTKKEPLYLPCKVPYILMAGMQGIAVGTTCGFPPFNIKGLIELVQMYLEGKEIKTKHLLKKLKINYKWGGINVTPKSDFKNYVKTGRGRFIVQHNYKVDPTKKQIIITGVGPNYDEERLNNKLFDVSEIASVIDQSSDKNGIRIVITLKPSVATKHIENIAKSIAGKAFNTSMTLATNVTARYLEEDALGDIVEDAAFIDTNIKDLLNEWCKWRVQLEVEMLKHRISKLKEDLAYQYLLKLAVDKIDVIFKVLKAKHESKVKMALDLSKKLKIKEEQANTILELQTYRLSKLNGTAIEKQIKELLLKIKQNEKSLKQPKQSVLDSITSLIKELKFIE